MKIKRIALLVMCLAMLGIVSVSLYAEQQPDAIAAGLNSRDDDRIDRAAKQIREGLASNPVETVDQLNRAWMFPLIRAKQYAAVEQFATTGTIAVAADTWRIEQLQRHRIEALLAENKPDEALRAAKALFNVCGMGFTKDALPLLVDSLKAAHPDDPSLVPKFKLQVLANAQEDPAERKRLLAKYGGNSVMDSIPADPEPYKEAIHRAELEQKTEDRRQKTEDAQQSAPSTQHYRELYGLGNLLLMSGRIKEAHDVFMKVYQIAPPGELKYASEGIAKLIKAEDGGLGKANQFVMSIRPKEQP